MDNKAEHAIVKGTLSMKVAAAVNSGGPAQGTCVDSKPLRVGNKRWKLSYKWNYNSQTRWHDLVLKVENMTNQIIKATITFKLVEPNGTNLSQTTTSVIGDKVYKAKSSVEMSLPNFSSNWFSEYGWTGAARAHLSCELGVAQTELQVNSLVQDLGQIFQDKDHSDVKVK